MSHPTLSRTGIQTRSIHAGEEPDPSTKASSPNLVMSTTFVTDANAGFSVEGIRKRTKDGYIQGGGTQLSISWRRSLLRSKRLRPLLLSAAGWVR